MGSGKSTVGKRLAEKLQFDFIDFDKHIENETGKTIAGIFDTEGEDQFRTLEHEHLEKLMVKKNTVISLGGGTPCFHNNIDLINKNGSSVYIEVGIDSLVKRLLKAKNKRPLIRGMNEMDLKYFIEANLEKRKPIYKQAQHSVIVENQSIEGVVDEIIQKIK